MPAEGVPIRVPNRESTYTTLSLLHLVLSPDDTSSLFSDLRVYMGTGNEKTFMCTYNLNQPHRHEQTRAFIL